jgi:hypothetical protein
VRAVQATIRERVRGVADRLVFLSADRLRRLRWLDARLPWGIGRRLLGRLELLAAGLEVLQGVPNEAALKLAYWRSASSTCPASRDPSRDGVGLLWYSPLVPMIPTAARQAVCLVRDVCPRHGIEPIITFSTVAEGCFDSTVPLLFDVTDAEQVRRASACYEELFERGTALGFVPYRVGVGQMHLLTRRAGPAAALGARLQRALDPHGLLSPGRYVASDPPVSNLPGKVG